MFLHIIILRSQSAKLTKKQNKKIERAEEDAQFSPSNEVPGDVTILPCEYMLRSLFSGVEWSFSGS